jgi:hypothetical protein
MCMDRGQGDFLESQTCQVCDRQAVPYPGPRSPPQPEPGHGGLANLVWLVAAPPVLPSGCVFLQGFTRDLPHPRPTTP